MDGPVEDEDQKDVHRGEMNRCGTPRAVEDGIGESGVEILVRSDEAGSDEDGGGDGGLDSPSAGIVSDAEDGPEQEQRQGNVIQRESAEPERDGAVEHVFGAADEVTSEDQARGCIESPNDTDCEAAQGLRREQQAILKGEAEAGEDEGDITEVEEIFPAPGLIVGGHPEAEPEDGGDAEPGWEAGFGCGGRGHGSVEAAW